jgi:hypothetical protein
VELYFHLLSLDHPYSDIPLTRILYAFATVRKEHHVRSFLHAVQYTLGRTLGCLVPIDDKDYKLLGLEEMEEEPTLASEATFAELYSTHFDGNQSENEKSQKGTHYGALWVEAVDKKKECIEGNDHEKMVESQVTDKDMQGTERVVFSSPRGGLI